MFSLLNYNLSFTDNQPSGRKTKHNIYFANRLNGQIEVEFSEKVAFLLDENRTRDSLFGK